MKIPAPVLLVALMLGVFGVLALLMPERLRQVGLVPVLIALATSAALLVIVGQGLSVRRDRGGEGPRTIGEGVRNALIWIGVIVVLMAGYTMRDRLFEASGGLAGVFAGQGERGTPGEGGALVLQRSPDGHFRVTIEVNGTRVHGMVDTGASGLALSGLDARAAGLDPDSLRQDTPVMTAAGASAAASVTLSSVRIGRAELRDVSALVLGDGTDTTLVGMDILSSFSEIRARGDTLELVY
jgi:aspartyl protease family protein